MKHTSLTAMLLAFGISTGSVIAEERSITFVPAGAYHQASATAWFNAMDKAALDALRPKYGDLYGFEAAVPKQIEMVRSVLQD